MSHSDRGAKGLKGRAEKKLVNKIETFLGIDPGELIHFLDNQLYLTSAEGIQDRIRFLDFIEQNNDVYVLRDILGKIKKEEIKKSSIDDIVKIGKEVSQSVKKHAKRITTISKWTTDLVFLGAILSGELGQSLYDLSMAELFYRTVYPAALGMRYGKIKKFFESITGSVFEKLLKKPIATTYWKSVKPGKEE